MPKKKRKDPDQGDLVDRKPTYEECKEAKGDRWKGDSSLGTKGGWLNPRTLFLCW